MISYKKHFKKYIPLIIAFIVIFFKIFVISFPQNFVSAARDGLMLWFLNVLPALLPFVVGINLLMAIGAINFLALIFGPFMRFVFNVPGAGGFAFVTGFISGYPIGVKVVSELRNSEKVTKTEAERLISFCNNSGPLFILGTVGIMFNSVSVGRFVLIIHYIGAILTGILFKYYKSSEKVSNNKHINFRSSLNILKHQKNDGYKSFGSILTESIAKSFKTMFIIGGFIIIFNVVIEIMKITYFASFGFNLISMLGININEEVFYGIVFGVVEITNGISYLSEQVSKASILAVGAVISFGGFSIHSQSISFLSTTDISIKAYFLAKLIHSIITVLIGIGIWSLFF